MRVILYTGKGGVGKTSLAAATAVATAETGQKTIVVSTDAAHSLGDSFNIELGNEPLEIQKNLWAQEVSTLSSTEAHWGKVQQYLSSLLLSQHLNDITTEELMVFPGLEELFCLLEILAHFRSGKYDVIIVDCAPTGETIRLLSFPEVLKWWLEKIFPMQKLVLKVARPVAKSIVGLPLPTDDALEGLADLVRQIQDMQDLLTDWTITSVRIVVNPEKMIIKEAERSFMYLSLYKFNVDAIIVNRLLPAVALGHYFEKWGEVQHTYLQYIKANFSPVPILTVPLFSEEVLGIVALKQLSSEAFKNIPSAGFLYLGQPQKITRINGIYLLELTLPFVSKGAIVLSQKGDELTIKIGEYKRNFYLPRKLQGRHANHAKLDADVLKIEFHKLTQ